MIKKSRIFVCLLTIAAMVAVSLPAAASEKKASGTVSVSFKSFAIGIGTQWGKGVLNFRGVDYPFKVSGFSVVDVGFTSIDATGTVYNLNIASDFAGTYTAGAVGIAVGGGAGAATLENQNGLKPFDAEGSFKDIGLKLKARYMLWREWNIQATAGYTRLLGDAADSPIVEDHGDANQYSGGIIFIYTFD